MPCPTAEEAVKFSIDHPEYAIGVHLTLTSEWGQYRWKPLTDGKSLIDEEGYMWHESDQVEQNVDLEEARAEIKAQIERCKKLGFVTPSHLDNHMGSLYGIETGRFELLQMTLQTAAEYGLPFRFPASFSDEQLSNTMLDINIDKDMIHAMLGQLVGFIRQLGVAVPDHLIPNEWNGPQTESYEKFREYIYDLYASMPEGITETYMHPSLETDDLKGTTGLWNHRVWEYQLLKDPKTKQHIEAHGIKLINYRDLAEMRK